MILHSVIEADNPAFSHYWDKLYQNDPLQHPLYAQPSHEGTELNREDSRFIDRSFLVIAEDEPVFACSVTTHTDECGRKCMGYFGMEASTHVNRSSMQESSNNFRPEAISLLQQHVGQLIEEIRPDSFNYLDPVSCGIMSPVTVLMLEKGATPTVEKAQVMDLTLSEHLLHRNLGKGYRGFINWGQRNLEIDVISQKNVDYKDLHSLQAVFQAGILVGNLPFSSWQAIEKLIRRGNAFLVQASYGSGLTANALFVHTKKSCHYVFGEIGPESSDRPVLHALIWEAILYSKRMGCVQLNLGRSSAGKADHAFDTAQVPGFGGQAHTRLKVTLAQ